MSAAGTQAPRSTGHCATCRVAPADHEPLRADLVDLDLFRCIVRRAERTPDAIAIAGERRTLNYAEFVARASSIAAAVRDFGAAGENVALALSVEDFPAAAFGVLAAGAAFVPLDASWPDPMLCDALAESGARLLLHDADHARRIESLRAASPATRSVAIESIDLPPAPVLRLDGRTRAAVYFTSGSTGRPKGVSMGHAFLLADSVLQANDACMAPSDRADLLYAPAFSATLMPLIGTLVTGASLHPFDSRAWLHRLPHWLIERSISVSRATTAILRFLCATGMRPTPSLRLLSVTGETLRAADVAAFRRTFAPHVVLRHGYGSSEARTIAHSFFHADDAVDDPVPVAAGLPDREISIVAADGRTLPPGEEGEVVVTARRLADGYLGDAGGRTRFVPLADGRTRLHTGDLGRLDAEGRLFLLGRLDDMVKVRGQRVEPSVVERAIAGVDGVEDAAVLAFARKDGATGLAAFVAARGVDVATLRAALVPILEPAAVPERIEILQTLPKNANGKVDRRRLLADRGLAADQGR